MIIIRKCTDSCHLTLPACRANKNTYAAFEPPSISRKLMIFPLLFLHEQSSILSQVSWEITVNSPEENIQIIMRTFTVLICFPSIIHNFNHPPENKYVSVNMAFQPSIVKVQLILVNQWLRVTYN